MFVRSGEPTCIRAIRVVRQYWRVQITVGVKSVPAGGKTVFHMGIGNSGRAVHGSKTAAAHIELTVRPQRYVLLRYDFYDPSKLATVLCGIIRGQHTHRIHTIRIERWRKGR